MLAALLSASANAESVACYTNGHYAYDYYDPTHDAGWMSVSCSESSGGGILWATAEARVRFLANGTRQLDVKLVDGLQATAYGLDSNRNIISTCSKSDTTANGTYQTDATGCDSAVLLSFWAMNYD
jgi:hypothetical protein